MEKYRVYCPKHGVVGNAIVWRDSAMRTMILHNQTAHSDNNGPAYIQVQNK